MFSENCLFQAFIISPICFLTLCAHLSAASDKDILLFAPNPLDLGYVVNPNENQRGEIVCRNSGDADIIIDKVVSGCGCTALTIDERHLKPNFSTVLHVSIDPKNKKGRVNVLGAIAFHDEKGHSSVSQIAFTCYVGREVKFDPGIVPLTEDTSSPSNACSFDLYLDQSLETWKLSTISSSLGDTTFSEQKSVEAPHNGISMIHVDVKITSKERKIPTEDYLLLDFAVSGMQGTRAVYVKIPLEASEHRYQKGGNNALSVSGVVLEGQTAIIPDLFISDPKGEYKSIDIYDEDGLLTPIASRGQGRWRVRLTLPNSLRTDTTSKLRYKLNGDSSEAAEVTVKISVIKR